MLTWLFYHRVECVFICVGVLLQTCLFLCINRGQVDVTRCKTSSRCARKEGCGTASSELFIPLRGRLAHMLRAWIISWLINWGINPQPFLNLFPFTFMVLFLVNRTYLVYRLLVRPECELVIEEIAMDTFHYFILLLFKK